MILIIMMVSYIKVDQRIMKSELVITSQIWLQKWRNKSIKKLHDTKFLKSKIK